MPSVWDYVDLVGQMEALVSGVTSQITQILPLGIGLIFILAVPRIVRRIINTFI